MHISTGERNLRLQSDDRAALKRMHSNIAFQNRTSCHLANQANMRKQQQQYCPEVRQEANMVVHVRRCITSCDETSIRNTDSVKKVVLQQQRVCAT